MNGTLSDMIKKLSKRRLDAVISETLGIKTGRHRERLCRVEYVGDDWGAASLEADIPDYSATDFGLVKREIEQRGWEWTCTYRSAKYGFKPVYIFTIRKGNIQSQAEMFANSEEIAGCCVFLDAMYLPEKLGELEKLLETQTNI